jgi:hypothetical protein
MTRKNDLSGDGEALPEPHHNSDVDARLSFFIKGYFEFTKDAADIYVRKCQLVLEAEENLPPEAVQRFYDRIRLPRNSATYRKVRKIAEAGDRLLKVADRLPDSWTTIYQLAKLEPHVFDELVKNEELHPGMTAAELRTVTEKPPENEEKEQFILIINGSVLSRGEQIQMYREVKEVADNYGATISDLPFAEFEHDEECR